MGSSTMTTRVNLLKPGEKITDFGWGIARKKPIEIHYREVIPNFETTITTQDSTGTNPPRHTHTMVEKIFTREGELFGYPDKDFVIKGVRGEIYPIGKDIFHETYDILEEARSSNQTAEKE